MQSQLLCLENIKRAKLSIYLIEVMQLIEGEICRWENEYVESSPEEKFLINYLPLLVEALVTILEQNETIKQSASGDYKTLQAHTHLF